MIPKKQPMPRFGERILKIFFKGQDLEDRLGDLAEVYDEKVRRFGPAAAGISRVFQILRTILSAGELFIYWSFAMFKNFLTIAFRNLRRHKAYSLITISGLAVGLASFLLVSVWVFHELSFDRFHAKASTIYLVKEERRFPERTELGYRTSGLLSARLKERYPEVLESARVAMTGERVLAYGDKIFYDSSILTVDPSFFTMFSYPFIEGDKEKALSIPHSIVISKTFAERYFGRENPLGKTLLMDDRIPLTVSAVIRDIPSNSHLQFEAAVPFEVVKELGWDTETWKFSMAMTYILLDRAADPAVFGRKIASLVKEFDPETNIGLLLHPLTRLHLFSNLIDPAGPGRIRYVRLLFLVGLLILIMACINFMNLSTARAERRGREIGLRKTIGAGRSGLVSQFLLEAIFIAGLSLLLAPLLMKLALPGFNAIVDGEFGLSDFFNVKMGLWVVGATLLAGILAGSYPALVLSSFQPVKVLQGNKSFRPGKSFLRRALVWTQMSASCVFLISTFVIYKQIDYLKTKNLGLDNEHVVTIPLGWSKAENKEIVARLKNGIRGIPGVERAASAFTHPTDFGTSPGQVVFEDRKLNEEASLSLTSIDADFLETLKIPVLKGRGFSEDFGAERGNLVINERMEKLLGVDSALDRTLKIGPTYSGRIIGVVKDFHMASVSKAPIGPLILFLNPNVNYIFVRLRDENTPSTLEALEKTWKAVAPHLPFKYGFLDEEFARLYADIDDLGFVLKSFTILAGLVAGLGLFALSAFAAEKRTREIGIRKVLGSSGRGIWLLLTGSFLKFVFLANLGAWPLAWLIMRNWLQGFPYRAELSWAPFVLSGLLVTGVTLATVSFQTVRASLAKPVDSMRYE